MDRRELLKLSAATPLLPLAWSVPWIARRAAAAGGSVAIRRSRPSDPSWPSAARWEWLNQQVDGQLFNVESPLAECERSPESEACAAIFKNLKNPYYIRDQAGLTQTSGWADAWVSAPSVYAVAARTTEHIAAAVNFARENNLRLVVKGGGHSYQGTSNAPDSLLIWTHEMNGIVLHDAFVGQGCEGSEAPQAAATVEAGAIWMHAYDAVTTKAGRYVQGGGCATVGVAGLVQSGGFGSFSKNFGTAAAGLLEAEIVTADGTVRIGNPCTNPDLFWAIKGGGGGSLGVVTKLTLRTHGLPDFFGGVFATIKATSGAAFRRLIGQFLGFYHDRLFNPHWGETIMFRPDNSLRIAMLFQGLDQQRASDAWRPFFDWVGGALQDFAMPSPPKVAAIPARRFWDPEFLSKNLPSLVRADDRPGAPEGNLFWAGDLGEAGQFLHGYESSWLPATLLQEDRQERLADALFAGTRHWPIGLHFNKGLAGAPADAVAAARNTAMNPAVCDAFALAICAAEGPPALPGIPGHEPDLALARKHAGEIAKAMDEMRQVAPDGGSYVSEGNFFDAGWQRSFWGENYARLRSVKAKYDPEGLFIVHHGVGSEDWSADGFTRLR